MGRLFTPYSIWCASLFACALGVTLIAWAIVPVVGNPWPSVVWFALFATLTELLAVNLGDLTGVSVSPSCTILWAATCVVGPFPAVVASVVCGVLSMAGKYVAYRLTCWFEARGFTEDAVLTSPPSRFGSVLGFVARGTAKVGALWQPWPLSITVQCIIACASNLVILVAPAGLVYYYLGGQFLLDFGPDHHLLRNFVFPFLALVTVSSGLDSAVYVLYELAMNPVPGTKGLYRLMLRAKLAFIEIALPLVRPQLFLLIVSLSLAYLYRHINLWGFVVAAMPALALRDFFRQWVEERAAYVNTITTLATYMQHYHPYTRGHLKRVADLSERLARELRLPAESVRHISTAGFLHDIGKIGVSEEILDKTSKLTDDEWAQIREHPVKGAEIISHIEFLDGIADWIRYHHKWYNGSGYPATNGDKLNIPIEAAIIATVDAFDAMTDDRELSIEWQCDSCGYRPEDGSRPVQCPMCGAEKRRTYREPKSLDEAIEELRRGAGSQFDPRVVKAFLSMVDRDGIRLDG